MAFRKIRAGLVNADIEEFVGEIGNIFFDIDTGSLRLSDGVTPGGVAVSGGAGGGSYTLPTATTTVKGGVKVDGTTINIANQVISVGTVPYSNISSAPTAVSAFTNDSGYITSSSLSSYATQTYVTTRGYITSAGIPSTVSSFSNDSGYLTTSGFDLDTIDLDANNKLHATGILPGDTDGFTAIFAGRAAGIAALPNTVIQSQAQVNDYAQNNFQNTFDGNHSSTEWVATSPNGDDSNYYIDMGFTGASWDGTASNSLYTNAGQRDGFLYVQGGNAGGGNLVLGTSLSNTYTKIISGDASAGNTEVARFSSTEVKLKKQLTFNDNTTQTTAWTGSVSWDNVTSKPTILTTLNSLDDVTTVGATDGQVLKYNASLNIWQPAADLVGSGGSGIGLTDLSASNAAASGGGNLSYNNTSGVFTFTPPDLSSYVTSSTLSSTLSTYATQTYVTSQGYITGSGNAATATKLGTARAINGVNFDGSAAITITASNPNALTIGTGLSGTSYDGSIAVTVAVDNTIARRADTTYVGTTSIALNRSSASQTLTGVSIDGNAATVTNGVYTTGTYANPSWITSLAYSKLTGTPTIFSGSYTDLTNKPSIPTNLSQLANDSGYITAAAIPAQFKFNVAADDSTLKTISSQETVKFIGAGGITTASDSEGAITITQGVAAAGTLTGTTLKSSVVTSSLTSVGTLTSLTVNSTSSTAVSITADGRPGSETNNWSFVSNQSIGGPRAWIQFPDSTLQTTAYTGNAATVTNGVYTTDTGTVTNTMLAGSIANNKLSNSSVTINGTSVSLGASATVTAAAGTLTGTTLASGVTASSLTSVGTLTGVTSNAVTAFTAGDAAISGVALQVPREGAIRNLYNGTGNNMYFDVSIGGTSNGQFQFRSSSAFTNVLTMSPTAFNVNTEAVVTARTASFGRLPWNSAIDTELTIDSYRFRISNSGGIFPQIISNVSGQTVNSAWTGVGAISGSAVTQVGSTGTLVPNNAWTTLYSAQGMNNPGDTVTVTLQDKQNGRIYRVTFMRSDNGSTTGYNIIAERLL